MEWLLKAVNQIRHKRRREIVRRFYLAHEPRESIQADMGLTDTQFRLEKTRGVDALRALRN